MKQIAAIVTNFNYARYLAHSIESLLQQTYPLRQILVVDDGSTDGSLTVAQSFGNKIELISQANAGQANAWWAAAQRLHADFVMLLDSDDIAMLHRSSVIQQVADENPNCGFIFQKLLEERNCGDFASAVRGRTENQTTIEPHLVDVRCEIEKGRSPNFRAPATSGLSFETGLFREMVRGGFGVGGIDVSDNYLKFVSLGLTAGIWLDDPAGVQRLHGENLYTGEYRPSIRRSIDLCTAREIETRFPALQRFAMALRRSAYPGGTRGLSLAATHEYRRIRARVNLSTRASWRLRQTARRVREQRADRRSRNS